MLLRTTKIISFSILLSFTILFSSCTLMTTMLEPFIAQLKSKVNYEEKELFSLQNLGFPSNSFFCEKSIAYDDDYIYCITKNDDYYNNCHGILVKTDYDGNHIKSIVLSDEANKYGYADCYAYNLRTIDVYDDVIIVNGEESVFSPRYTELICLDKKSLQVLWHWHSAAVGLNAGSSTSKWNDKYVFCYDDSESGEIAWLSIIDENGNELVTKQIGNSGWADISSPIITDNIIIVRTTESSYEAYDLNLLLNPTLASEDCMVSKPDHKDSYYSTTGIVTDENCFYTHSICRNDIDGTVERFIDCRSKDTFKEKWKTQLDKTFSFVNGIPMLHDKKLYVPADYGSIYCFNTENGKQIWHTDIRENKDDSCKVNLFANSCIVSDRWLCITCNSTQELLVLDSRNGEIMARINVVVTPTAIQSFSKDGYLYLAGANSLYRFRFWEK